MQPKAEPNRVNESMRDEQENKAYEHVDDKHENKLTSIEAPIDLKKTEEVKPILKKGVSGLNGDKPNQQERKASDTQSQSKAENESMPDEQGIRAPGPTDEKPKIEQPPSIQIPEEVKPILKNESLRPTEEAPKAEKEPDAASTKPILKKETEGNPYVQREPIVSAERKIKPILKREKAAAKQLVGSLDKPILNQEDSTPESKEIMNYVEAQRRSPVNKQQKDQEAQNIETYLDTFKTTHPGFISFPEFLQIAPRAGLGNKSYKVCFFIDKYQ